MNSFGVQLTYASVHREDEGDPREAALGVLRAQRVLAGIQDATAEWDPQGESVLLIPTTDDGTVLTLGDDDRIVTELSVTGLRTMFADAGLALSLLDTDDDAEPEESEEFDEFDDELDSLADEYATVDFEVKPVRVASFSRRSLWSARYLAQANRVPVEHVEAGGWSLQLYQTTEPTKSWPSSGAELPSIDVNRPGSAGGIWVDVTVGGLLSHPTPFWLDAERDTVPVLDLDAITVSESAEVYRRLLGEGDGSRDELEEIAGTHRFDVDAAHAALRAEALGGIVGSEARVRAFLTAFGVPDELIAFSLDADAAAPDLERHVVTPDGWGKVIGEAIVDGYSESVPLSRRDRPVPRLARWLRAEPWRRITVSGVQLAVGVAAASGGGRVRRGAGALLIIDALGDIVAWSIRRRRGQ